MSISTQITVAATAETIIITAPGALRGPMGDVTPEAQILVERAETAAAQSQSSAGQAASSAAQAGDSASQAANSASSAAQSAAAASDSETAAGVSASSAQDSASSATDSAAAAASSQGAAQASADQAQASESSASQSAASAAGSETAAGASASSAQASASSASASASSAQSSAEDAAQVVAGVSSRLADLVNVEEFRLSGFSDSQTIQAGCDSGRSLKFGNRTYTFAANETVLNDFCHAWFCEGTTFKVADGAILNNNTSLREHTAILRVRGVQGFAILGSWTLEGNRDEQTYPANTSDFGRGTALLGAAGRRTNGIFEFTPASDNLTPCRDIVLDNGTVKNAYLNGLVFWQCENVLVRNTRTEYSTMNGIAGGGCKDVLITGCTHFRDGASDAVPSTVLPIGFGDRAGVQFREILPSFTAAKLGMPMIPVSTYAQINININIVDDSGDECGVETLFLRGCFPGRMINCTSRNAGYKRLEGVDTGGAPYFAPAHFWAELGQYEFDVVGYQTKETPAGWMSPLLAVCFSFSGNGYTSPSNPVAVAGDFTSTVKAKGYCFRTETGAKRNNFGKGVLLTSCTVADIEIEGCVGDPITIINDPNFNLRPPHDVSLVANVSNCIADRAVLITRYPAPVGTIAGPANNLKVKLNASDIRSQLTGTDDHALLDVSITMSDYLMDNFEATDLVLDGANTSGNFNGVRLRANAASRNMLVRFQQCTNMITPFRSQGFRNLKLEGSIESCLRAWLVDLSTSGVDTEEFDFSGIRTYDITTEMFSILGAATRRIKVLKASGALLKGRVGTRTWSIASTVDFVPDTFAQQIGTFFWKDVINDYGSSSPSTLVQDMRRRFSSSVTLAAAKPMYQGEIVLRADNGAVYMARSATTGDWSLLA